MMQLLFTMGDIKEKIGTWNNQINGFFENHLSSPFMGYLLFFGLLAVAVIFITANYQK